MSVMADIVVNNVKCLDATWSFVFPLSSWQGLQQQVAFLACV